MMFSDLYVILGGAVALLLGLLGVWKGGKSAGRKDEQNDQMRRRVKAQEKHKDKVDEVDSLDAAALDKRGRRWLRDPDA